VESVPLSGESAPYTSAQVALLLRCAQAAAIAHELYQHHQGVAEAVEIGDADWTDDDVAIAHDRYYHAMDDLSVTIADLASIVSPTPVASAMDRGLPLPRITRDEAPEVG